MTATNHVLTGSLIGLSIHQPLLAIPLAFASHFVLDTLPHYGDENHTRTRFITILGIDMSLASLLLLGLVLLRPVQWQLSVACGIAAASPDLMWLPMWLRELQHKHVKFNGPIRRFHKKIQWAESSRNYPVEILWAIVSVLLLVELI